MKKLMKYLAVVICSIAVVGWVAAKPGSRPVTRTEGVDSVTIMTAPTSVTNTMGSSSYRKVYEIAFTTVGSFTWKASSTLPAIRSVEMSYPTGIVRSNTFTLTYLRNGVSRDLTTATASDMHTTAWYLPSDFYAVEGDVWSWSNTVAGAAVLTINADFQY